MKSASGRELARPSVIHAHVKGSYSRNRNENLRKERDGRLDYSDVYTKLGRDGICLQMCKLEFFNFPGVARFIPAFTRSPKYLQWVSQVAGVFRKPESNGKIATLISLHGP